MVHHSAFAFVALAAAALFGGVAAQGDGGVPACATTCAAEVATAVGCNGVTDTNCLCGSSAQAFFSLGGECLGSTCSQSDLSDAMVAFLAICDATPTGGNTNLPTASGTVGSGTNLPTPPLSIPGGGTSFSTTPASFSPSTSGGASTPVLPSSSVASTPSALPSLPPPSPFPSISQGPQPVSTASSAGPTTTSPSAALSRAGHVGGALAAGAVGALVVAAVSAWAVV